VQGFVGASVPDDTSTYEGVMCTVCNRVHLVNPSNGHVAGAEMSASTRKL
jgi:hypothetical protein